MELTFVCVNSRGQLLHWAALHDSRSSAEWLIKRGADRLLRTKEGLSYLQLALRKGNVAFVDAAKAAVESVVSDSYFQRLFFPVCPILLCLGVR
jgi:ankyrin repeat protein